jgi:tRNA pseudouridine32 synthase/23S rRNA pseudouridine746 synthase
LGDDLYGKKDKRLYLHAAEIEFLHPFSNAILKIVDNANFSI